MNLGGISGAIDAVSAEFGLNALMKGFVTSSLMAGCLFGALSGGSLSDKFGRKAILTVSEILLLVSAVGCGFFSHGAWPLVVYRFLAGLGVGALSAVTCQRLADITGRTVEVVAEPQNVGAVGAAAVMGVGLGLIPDLDAAGAFIPVAARYVPDPERNRAYAPYYAVFQELYRSNQKNFRALNGLGK